MAPEVLAQVLRPLNNLFDRKNHRDLLVGLGEADDAAVYKLNSEQAIISTTDFFTPVVDDPYDFGAIAAANSMSDVYAMGGEVIFALNVSAFPANLPPDIITEILRGGAEKGHRGRGRDCRGTHHYRRRAEVRPRRNRDRSPGTLLYQRGRPGPATCWC